MNSLKLGMFLVVKTVLHASKWTTALIIMVMLITFLNLIIVSGILVGLIQGSEVGSREKYLGDVIVSPLEKKTKIESWEIESLLAGIPDVKGYTARYISGGSVEANYATRHPVMTLLTKKNVSIRGINPEQEDVAQS